MYLLYELLPKIFRAEGNYKTFVTYFRSILLTASCVMLIWLLFNKERFHWTYDISTGEPVDHYSTYGRCITFTVIALVSNIMGIILQLKRNSNNRKRFYNIILFVLTTCLVIAFAYWLKIEWDDTVIEQKGIPVLEVSDLKKGDEFQFRDIPWGASVEEVKAIVTSAHTLAEYSPGTQYLSTESYLLLGKAVNLIYHFEDGKLEKVQLLYDGKHQKKQFKLLVEEFTEVFGPPTSKVDETKKERYYVWAADNTVMQINTISGDGMMFFIYSE